MKEKPNTQALGAIKSLISSIRSATSREELALLIRAVKTYAQDNTELLSEIKATADKVEEAICAKEHGVAYDKEMALSTKKDEELKEIVAKAPELTVNLSAIASVLNLAKNAAFGQKADNIYDGAFGETIKALEAQEAKEVQREGSKTRVDVLRNLGEVIEKSETLDPGVQDALIAQAATLKITLTKDKNGKLVANSKGLKAIEKIANLNLAEVEKKRETRKAKDNIDNLDQAIGDIGFGSLFDDPPAEAPSKASPPDLMQLADDVLSEEEKKSQAMSLLESANRKDSTHGGDLEKLSAENNLGLKTIAALEGKDESGNLKKVFKNAETDVTLTTKYNHAQPFDKVRDVDIHIDKGPAVVSLEMSDSHGRKVPGEHFIVEYGEDGKAKATIPDLALVKFHESLDPSKPSIAYIEVDGQQVILPINGDKVDLLKKEISEHRSMLPKKDHSSEELLVKESGVSAPQVDLERISSLAPEAKTSEDIQKEYSNMLLEYAGLKASAKEHPDDPKIKDALELSDKKLGEYQELHAKNPSMEKTHQDKNAAAMIAAIEQADKTLKDKAIKKLEDGIEREINAGADNDALAVQAACSQQEKARSELKALGVDVKEVKEVEKATITKFLLKAVEAEITERLVGQDPIGSALRKNQTLLIGATMGVPKEEMSKTIAETAKNIEAKSPGDPAVKLACSRASGVAKSESKAEKIVHDTMSKSKTTTNLVSRMVAGRERKQGEVGRGI